MSDLVHEAVRRAAAQTASLVADERVASRDGNASVVAPGFDETARLHAQIREVLVVGNAPGDCPARSRTIRRVNRLAAMSLYDGEWEQPNPLVQLLSILQIAESK